MFQLVKVVLSSVVALFGTYQIAANGVAQTIWLVCGIIFWRRFKQGKWKTFRVI